MKKTALLILIGCAIFSTSVISQDITSTKGSESFSSITSNLDIHKILLEQKDNESNYKIEIAAGMMKEVDCNSHSLIGSFEEKKLDELGYSIYIFHTEGHTMSTSKGCIEPKKEKLIMGANMSITYNSKYPLVIYAPKGVQIKYRINKKEEE